jgi:hypothetical protein
VRSKTLVVAISILALALPVLAQDAQMSAQQKAAMEAMEKAGTPGAPHKMLDPMVGTFDTVVTFYPAPGAQPMSSKGVSVNRWILGGRYMEQVFKGTAMGQPFEGIGYTGYDNINKRYFGTWMDSMSTGLMTTTGATADNGKSWTYKGTMDDPVTGKPMPVEEKVMVVSRDKHAFEMWNPGPDGKMYRSMEITYTRKKK